MSRYFKRMSTVSSGIGLILSIALFVPALRADAITIGGLHSVVSGVLGLFCTFVVTSFLQQVELERELSDRVDAAKQDIAATVKRIHDNIEVVTPIARLAVSEPACAAQVSQAAAQLHAVARNPKHPQVLRHAGRIVNDFHDAAAALVDGKFVTPFWDCDILRHELEKMKDYLIGYSPLIEADECEWWSSKSGIDFFEANRRVLDGNHCQITRIFCVPDDLSSVEAILRRHKNLNVDVYYLTRDRVDPSFHRFDESSAVIDGKIAYYSETRPGNAKVNIWTASTKEVKDRQHRLENLRDKARRYHP